MKPALPVRPTGSRIAPAPDWGLGSTFPFLYPPHSWTRGPSRDAAVKKASTICCPPRAPKDVFFSLSATLSGGSSVSPGPWWKVGRLLATRLFPLQGWSLSSGPWHPLPTIPAPLSATLLEEPPPQWPSTSSARKRGEEPRLRWVPFTNHPKLTSRKLAKSHSFAFLLFGGGQREREKIPSGLHAQHRAPHGA